MFPDLTSLGQATAQLENTCQHPNESLCIYVDIYPEITIQLLRKLLEILCIP